MIVNLNKEEKFNDGSMCLSTIQDHDNCVSFGNFQVGVEFDGSKFIIDVDIDISYSLHIEHDERGNVSYWSSTKESINVLFNEGWNSDGDVCDFTGFNMVAKIEEAIKNEINK